MKKDHKQFQILNKFTIKRKLTILGKTFMTLQMEFHQNMLMDLFLAFVMMNIAKVVFGSLILTIDLMVFKIKILLLSRLIKYVNTI